MNGQCSTQICGSVSSNCLYDALGNKFAVPAGICATSSGTPSAGFPSPPLFAYSLEGARGAAKLQSYSMHNRSDIEKYYEMATKVRFLSIPIAFP
jgi:hypothetical protein